MKLLLIFFLFFTSFLFSQNDFKSNKINDLVQLLHDDSKYNKYNLKEKQAISEALIRESKIRNDVNGQLIGMDFLTSSLNNTSDLEKFYEISIEGLQLSKIIKDQVYENKFLLNLGKFKQDIGQIKESDSIFMIVIQNVSSSKNEVNIATISKAFLYLSINQLYSTEVNIGLMKYYEDKSLEYALRVKSNLSLRNKCLLNTYSKQISYLMNENDYELAEKLLIKVDSISKTFLDKTYQIGPLLQYGYLYIHKKMPEKALVYYLSAEQISKETNFKKSLIDIYFGIYKCYKNLNDSKNALVYLEKLEAYGEMINKIERTALIKSLNKESSQKKKTESYFYVFLPILILVFSLIVLMFLFRKRFFQKKIIQEKDEVLQDEVVEEINKDVEKLQEFFRIAVEENEVFINLYIKAFPEFYEKMKLFGMTNSEIEICAMTKLNIDTKQIARVKDLTVRSVESKKYRIRKKLNLTPTEELASWLMLNS